MKFFFKKNIELLLLLISLCIGTILFITAARAQSDFNPRDFGLGLNTTSKIGYDSSGRQLSSISADIDGTRKSFAAFKREGKHIVLWLGASQLHAINDIRPTDRMAFEYANQAATRRNANTIYLQSTTPKASSYDLLLLYLLYRQKNHKPDWLIVPAVYNDLGNYQPQRELIQKLSVFPQELSERDQGLKNLQEQFRLAAEENKKNVRYSNIAFLGTPQNALELKLTSVLEQYFPGYTSRQQLRSKLEAEQETQITKVITGLYGLLRGSGTYQRHPDIDEQRIRYNTQGLMSLLDIAQQDGVKVLVYQQPLRPTGQTDIFYFDRERYNRFYVSLLEITKTQRHVSYLDLNNIVPVELWGRTNLNYWDIFHFKNEGHKLLGAAIDAFFAKNP